MIPENLILLHNGEEQLRRQAVALINDSANLQLHLSTVEAAMDLADMYRQHATKDEDLKVTQLLGMRCFNAFAASLKLALSGYSQNAALIQRDILETIFLLDLFDSHRELIERWRFSDKKTRMKEFSPVKVREMLDTRDGYTTKKRFEMYEMFSVLAGHPNMNSSLMMRPKKGGDAVVGPFIEPTTLDAVLSEMGRLAVQVGEKIEAFMPKDWPDALGSRHAFAEVKLRWIQTFYRKDKSKS